MRVIDHLKEVVVGHRYAELTPLKFTEFKHDYVPDMEIPQKQRVYETSAFFSVRAIGTGAIGEEEHIRKQAAQMVARELYGEVVEKLIDIEEAIMQDRPRYGDKVFELVADLIDELSVRDKFR